MAMPGRTYAAPGSLDDKYRYSHNGQEKDNDIFIGALSAEYWEYDSRTGRRWENDPLTYPWQSSYACFNNNPIYFADPSGLEGEERGGDGGGRPNSSSGDHTYSSPSEPTTPNRHRGDSSPGGQADYGSSSGEGSAKLPGTSKDKGNPNSAPKTNDTAKKPLPTQTSGKGSNSGSKVTVLNNNIKLAYRNDYYNKALRLKVFMDGATNAASSNMALGYGRKDPRQYSKDPFIQQIYAIGQIAGDVASVAAGDAEIAAGETGLVYAGGMAATGVGAIPAAGVAVGSGLVIAHGVSTISFATAGMIKTAIILKSINHHNNNSKAADTGGGSEKFEKMGKQKGSSAEKMPDDVAKKLGIKNKKKFMDYLHKLKKAERRSGADNYTWDDLIDIGKEFLEINGNK